jgi:hypothetical protein
MTQTAVVTKQETAKRRASREQVTSVERALSILELNDDYLPSLGKIVQTAALKLSAQLGGRRSR